MSLKLIHFPITRSLRVVWTLFELGVDAEIETRPFDRRSLKDPGYLALNPLGKVPVFFDGDKRIIESVAIAEYIANKYAGGKLTRGPEDPDYADYLQWREFGEAGMGGYVGQLVGHTVLLPEEHRIESMRIWATNETRNCLDFIEQNLADEGYIHGEFSLADISLGYILFLIKISRNGKLFGEKTNAYFDRLKNRDAWKEASALQPAG